MTYLELNYSMIDESYVFYKYQYKRFQKQNILKNVRTYLYFIVELDPQFDMNIFYNIFLNTPEY